MRLAASALVLLLPLAPASAFQPPASDLSLGPADALARAAGIDASGATPFPPRTLGLADLVEAADLRLGVVRAPGTLDALLALEPALQDVAADLLHAVLFAAAERDAAFAGVSDAELAALADTEAATPETLALLARVDEARVRAAALGLAQAVEAARPRLEALAAAAPGRATLSAAGDPARAPLPAPAVDVFPVLGIDPLGVDNAFPHDYVLSIDLGGSDVYDNNAGGSILFGRGFIVGDPSTFGPSIPFTGLTMGGEYEDAAETYTATVAIDVAGDDTYGVYKAPSLVGGSRDKLCTTGPLVRRIVVQGSGSGGIGQLYDLEGNDQYRGKTLAQGNGHVKGVGLLFDGAGDDRYTAIRSAQAAAVLEGVGVLLDQAGADRYEMLAPPGGIWNVDRARCDAGQRLALGATILQGGALFVDAAGDDVYRVDAQALGHSEATQSVGVFLDAAGSDDYGGYAGRGDGVRLVTQSFAGAGVFQDL